MRQDGCKHATGWHEASGRFLPRGTSRRADSGSGLGCPSRDSRTPPQLGQVRIQPRSFFSLSTLSSFEYRSIEEQTDCERIKRTRETETHAPHTDWPLTNN